jgi:DNA repair photolyase
MEHHAENPVEKGRRKGRGARSNDAPRFQAQRREPFADDWEPAEETQIRTEVREEVPKTILTKNTSPDVPFNVSLNPYRGCEHGCIYCFARPSHAYWDLSPGLDFETKLTAKPDAPALLEAALRKKNYVVRPIAIGTNTDPYQPIEKKYQIMRGVLEVLREYKHPVAIVTKGSLIERDLDILGDMAAMGLASVGVSVTTLDPKLSRQMEPRAPSPKRRLQMIKGLAEAGVPVRVMASPMIPGLTDPELEKILESGAKAGATAAGWIMLRLPLEVSGLFQDWLAEHRPGYAAKVMARVRDSHGGRDYDPEWGRRMRGSGVYAQLIARRFDAAVARLGLDQPRAPLRCDLFERPLRVGDQMRLF